MAFTLPVFPALRGQKIDTLMRPEFDTTVHTSTSGKEQRFSRRSLPIWEFTLTYDVIRDDATNAELENLAGFYLRQGGSLLPFLIKRPNDNFRAAQGIGTGNGVQTAFQIQRDYGTFREPVYAVDPGFTVTINGTPTVAFTETDGLITFTVAPAAAAVIAVQDITFYYRVRFKSDSLDFNREFSTIWNCRRLEMVSVK